MKRIEIPIRQIKLPSGSIRYSVSLTIGGKAVEAMLDSGSVGLRLLPGAVSAKSIKVEDRECVYSFSNGVELTGYFARAKLALGGVRLRRDVYVQSAKDIGCVAHKPNCPAAQIRAAGYRIFGEGFPGKGFRAVLGVGLRAAGVPNPLTYFGDAWIINLPMPHQDAPGSLIINPNPAERRGYTRFTLARDYAVTPLGDVAGWKDDIPGSIINTSSGRSISGPILLDTGAPSLMIVSNEADLQTWAQHSPVTLQFEGGDRGVIAAKFNSGSVPGSRIWMSKPPITRPREGIRAGMLPYLFFSALYDNKRGKIGLLARPKDMGSAAEIR